MKQKIVFFGSSRYVIPIIEVLKKNFDLSLVITTEQNPSNPIPHFCNKNKIKYISVTSLNNSIVNDQLSMVNCQLAILADFGLIIPKRVLKIFQKGIINIHPSLLPKYRGPTPVQNAILNGENMTGISIIKLDDKVDHGPILAQKEEKILEDDTADTLYARLFEIGADLIYQNIKHYIKGYLKPRQQIHSKATFTKLLQKNDGLINLDNPPSPIKIARMIRAYHPWPGVWTKLQIVAGSTRGVDVQKIIKFLPEQKIQVEGKNPVSYKDFTNGYSKGKDILEKLKLTI
ncbi:MAG: hypothetical protein A3H50_03120 [Candidatus Levybacteria bacterium RIFCSPLOWO2_02_FULL_37_10]|nr:MAG: hypothetical protein A2860_00795 [Candidatus Levybacteria bacterium RIFCSPHIGHO2_01_FULL_37_33]OGH16308.1 MAG: hypothetical protein A3C97_03105 [Candidatus Levybacteria bacterium RIFCSPHIGHO2_02_FULL_37_11]OGH29256.1 MAG: hypothetical protein A3F30_00560 [Candidatus Levybacteria bacterium RIFCSPHIGHO2_12_FULL_37_12]OGH32539.1 MAG: hypothetical protein A2953_00235 [Candidatus Levybacteria bacterium RIFCSPLOWO2_01_FULL_36_54]OGH43398.1 MAG: hypothetical protein A3H50_03120 [Candidatus Lev